MSEPKDPVIKECEHGLESGCLTCYNKKIEKWEVYFDPSYYDLWAVRRIGDKDFNSPSLFHFVHKSDAEAFKQLAEISQ